MALINALTENFEDGASGSVLSASNSIFTNISGSGTDPVFVDNPYEGDLAVQLTAAAGALKTLRVDFTSQSTAWFGFALRLGSAPTSVATVLQVYQGTTIGFGIRVDTNNTLQLRDGTTTRFTSPSLTLNEWYWVSVQFSPGSASGARLKLYDRAAVNVFDSGVGAATSTAANGIDNLRIGYLAGTGDVTVAFDKIRADTVNEIAPVSATTANLTVDITIDIDKPEADDVVTLTAVSTGGSAPFTYTWSQIGGAAVSLSGSGMSRALTAPAFTKATTLTFQCVVTPAAGSPVTAVAEVPVLAHNFWTMHGGVLVPRRIKTRRGGTLIG